MNHRPAVAAEKLWHLQLFKRSSGCSASSKLVLKSIMILGVTRCAELGGGWSTQSFSDILASELTSQIFVTRERVKTCSGWEVQTSPSYVALHCSSLRYQCLWKNTPPDKKTGRTISVESTNSGAGLQFPPLDCRAKARTKGVLFFTDADMCLCILTVGGTYSA